jgi:hypothetical protein
MYIVHNKKCLNQITNGDQEIYMYIITTVSWSQESDHVSSTGMDH